MRMKMKDDELRFRHAANDNPHATLAQLAAIAKVTHERAVNLQKRWHGAQGQALPPLPPPIENTPDEPEAPAASESPNTDPAPSGSDAVAVASESEGFDIE